MENKESNNKGSEYVKTDHPKPDVTDDETERGNVEQKGYEEERYRRNQEWSPTQDTEYQTGGSHSEEDTEAVEKNAA